MYWCGLGDEVQAWEGRISQETDTGVIGGLQAASLPLRGGEGKGVAGVDSSSAARYGSGAPKAVSDGAGAPRR